MIYELHFKTHEKEAASTIPYNGFAKNPMKHARGTGLAASSGANTGVQKSVGARLCSQPKKMVPRLLKVPFFLRPITPEFTGSPTTFYRDVPARPWRRGLVQGLLHLGRLRARM